MRILVCGSEGRLMSSVIPLLLRNGHEVVGVDNFAKWGERPANREYSFIHGNCCDPVLMRPLVSSADAVIQGVASLYGVIGFHRRPADILTNDVGAHQNVLRLASEADVQRVIFISSSVVYERCHGEPYEEEQGDDPPLPYTDYGLSKVIGERLSKAYWKQYGVPFTIWRPFNIFDPLEDGSDDAGVCHVFADFIYRLIVRQQNPLEILGNGNQLRSFVHMKEVAEAIATFSLDPRTKNQVYNLGRSEVVSMRDLGRRIYQKACANGLIPSSRPLEFKSLPVPATDVQRRVGSFAKADRELGWSSETDLDSMLDETMQIFVQRYAAMATAS